jgi:hypothetical protein
MMKWIAAHERGVDLRSGPAGADESDPSSAAVVNTRMDGGTGEPWFCYSRVEDKPC